MKILRPQLPLEKIKISAVFLFPCMVLVLGVLLKNAAGPYWLAANQDPAYQYLLNSLMIIDHQVPNHVDHPGTPLQLFGSGVISLLEWGKNRQAIISDVLSRPEAFLNAVHLCLFLSFLVSLLLIGYFVFSKTGDILFSLLVQSSSLIFLLLPSNVYDKFVLPVISNVNPEMLQITIGNLYILCLLTLYGEVSSGRVFQIAVLWGIVAGAGAAAKITFLPLWAAPLILIPGIRRKIAFLFMSVASFVIFTLPAVSRYPYIFSWFKKISIHTGIYGAGSVGIIEGGRFFKSLCQLIQDNAYFFAVNFAAIGFLIYCFVLRRKKISHDGSKVLLSVKFLSAVTLTSVLQIAAVAKHPTSHYLVPAMSLAGFQLAMIYQSFNHAPRRPVNIVTVVFLIFIVTGHVLGAINYQVKLNRATQEALVFSKKVFSDYRPCIIFSYYRASSQALALDYANEWDWRYPFSDILQEQYPSAFFYSRGRQIFHNFTKRLSLENLKELQSKGQCLLLYGTPGDFVYGFLETEVIDSAGKERLYRIRAIPSSVTVANHLKVKHY